MKKVYQHPQVVIEEFAPNEYVAACGESGTVYKFKCNAGDSGKRYNVYYNDGTEDSHTRGTAYYHPCNTTHEAESNSGFKEGYMIETYYTGILFPQEHEKGDRIPVIIWTNNGTNVHCTTDLKMDHWETAKS